MQTPTWRGVQTFIIQQSYYYLSPCILLNQTLFLFPVLHFVDMTMPFLGTWVLLLLILHRLMFSHKCHHNWDFLETCNSIFIIKNVICNWEISCKTIPFNYNWQFFFSSDKDFGTVLEIQILCSSIANDKFSSNDNDLRTVLKIQILWFQVSHLGITPTRWSYIDKSISI
jgi:hypothetical protein